MNVRYCLITRVLSPRPILARYFLGLKQPGRPLDDLSHLVLKILHCSWNPKAVTAPRKGLLLSWFG